MKKAVTFLCGMTAAVLMTGCGSVMPDLTEEETEIISEYAVGVLLKYDRVSSGRLMSQAEYESAEVKKLEKENTKAAEKSETEEEADAPDSTAETETVDVSQEEEVDVAAPSTIEEYYDIQDFTFQYSGYELAQSYRILGENDKALEAYNKVIQLFPDSWRAENSKSYIDRLNGN